MSFPKSWASNGGKGVLQGLSVSECILKTCYEHIQIIYIMPDCSFYILFLKQLFISYFNWLGVTAHTWHPLLKVRKVESSPSIWSPLLSPSVSLSGVEHATISNLGYVFQDIQRIYKHMWTHVLTFLQKLVTIQCTVFCHILSPTFFFLGIGDWSQGHCTIELLL